MLAVYNKTYLAHTQQIALLKSRGLQFKDEAAAEDCLHRNGYYRLSAYWYPFRAIGPLFDDSGNPIIENGTHKRGRTNTFLSDSWFEDAQLLYVFDKELKLILLDAIERIEIAVRGEIAVCLAPHDIYAHTNTCSGTFFRSAFTDLCTGTNGNSQHHDWITKYNRAVNGSNAEFVKHHRTKYGKHSKLPIWMAIEVWDFGSMSTLYQGLDNAYRDPITSRFGVSNSEYMVSWLRCLNFVRNVIAHHGRLWNLNLAVNPKLPRVGEMLDFDVLAPNAAVPLSNANVRIYSICCILAYFSKVINHRSHWHFKLADHIRNFPAMPHATIQNMGFPAEWETHTFWQ